MHALTGREKSGNQHGQNASNERDEIFLYPAPCRALCLDGIPACTGGVGAEFGGAFDLSFGFALRACASDGARLGDYDGSRAFHHCAGRTGQTGSDFMDDALSAGSQLGHHTHPGFHG